MPKECPKCKFHTRRINSLEDCRRCGWYFKHYQPRELVVDERTGLRVIPGIKCDTIGTGFPRIKGVKPDIISEFNTTFVKSHTELNLFFVCLIIMAIIIILI